MTRRILFVRRLVFRLRDDPDPDREFRELLFARWELDLDDADDLDLDELRPGSPTQ